MLISFPSPIEVLRFSISEALQGDQFAIAFLINTDAAFRQSGVGVSEYRELWMEAAKGLSLTAELSRSLIRAGASFMLIEAIYGVQL